MESPRFMWMAASVLFGVGGAIGALSLIVPHPESFDDTALWGNIALAFSGSALALLVAGRWPAWPLYPLIAGGVVLITHAGYYSHDPSGFYTLFYVWVGLFSFFFFSRRTAMLFIALIGIAYGALLILDDATAGIARWVTTIGTVALAALLIDTLVRRLRGALRRSSALARERAELLEMVEKVARTDDLTGLPNRRAWDEALERELARARRESTPLCLGLIDLDRFKAFNDEHGHQAGDRLLKEIAALWRSELRTTDVLARYGGEEFALALPGCSSQDGAVLLERLRAATPGEQTCSAGLVVWDASETAERLFGRADAALYEAKESGRDRTVIAA